MPGRGPFPVRGLFWDTPGQNIAIVRHPGTHNVNISPPPGAWECISRAPCRRRTAESALRAHVAMRWPPGNTIRGHMPPCPTADDAPRQHIVSKATLRLRKGQHARSHRTPPEPIREMRRCPAAAVGTAAMKELGHRRAAYWGAGGALMRAAYLEHRRGIGARGLLGGAREGH